MTISVRLWSKNYAKVAISHESVKFEPEMMSKDELKDLLVSLREGVDCIESVIESLESYEEDV
jgi:hypothetical protein